MASRSETLGDGLVVTVDYPDETDLAEGFALLPTNGGRLTLPASTIAVSDTLNFRNRAGCHIEGQGAPGIDGATNTKLLWIGPTDGRPMLDMSGTRQCSVSRLGMFGRNQGAPSGASPNVVGILARGNPTYQGCFFNTLEHLHVQDFAVGVELGSGTDQVDSWTINKTFVYQGTTSTGIKVNSTNALTIAVTDTSVVGVGGSTPDEACGIHVVVGALKARNIITANTAYGVRIDAMVGTSSISASHSENDDHPIFTPPGGNHQHANALRIDDFYAYSCNLAFLHLANANIQYTVQDAYCQPSGGSGDVFVPDDPVEVWLWNVTTPGAVKRASDGVAVSVFGYYGAQGPAARYLRVPTLEMRSPNGTAYRLAPPNAGGTATWTAV